MKSKKEIAEQFKKHKQLADNLLGKQYRNTRKCQAFYAGDFMKYEDRIQYTDENGNKKRALVQFNKVKPYVNAVNGFFVQIRGKPKYIAKMDSQVGALYSKYANALSDYIRDNANASHIETRQDKDMLINGYGAVETALTYHQGQLGDETNGEVIMGRLDPLSTWFDPYARESNIIDARFAGSSKKYNLQDAIDLFDEPEESFEDYEDQEDDSEYYPDGGSYDKIAYEWHNESDKMVNVHFYQWYDIEKYYRAENPLEILNNPESRQAAQLELEAISEELNNNDGDLTPESDFDPKAPILVFNEKTRVKLEEIFGEFIDPKEIKVKRYYTAVISGEKVFTAFESSSQQGFSIKFKTGDFDENSKIWTGMVNSLMEPALYYSKALTELMFIIGANSKGGVMYEEDAVEDIDEFEQQYALTDSAVRVNSGALSQGKIQPKATPAIPTGYENIIGISDAALNDVSGIDKTFLGSSENRMETAQLQRQRVRQVVSTMASYVDNINLYQKEHAKLMVDYMRIYAENNRGGLFSMLGEDGTQQFVTISEDKFFVKYEVSIDEAPQTKEERQEYVTILSTIADKLMAVGDPTGKLVYSIAIKYMPIDKEDQVKLTKILVPDQDNVDPAYVQKLEQQIQQLQSEGNKVALNKILSEIQLNNAKVTDTNASAHKKAAETTESLESAEQTNLENDMIKSRTKDSELKVII